MMRRPHGRFRLHTCLFVLASVVPSPVVAQHGSFSLAFVLKGATPDGTATITSDLPGQDPNSPEDGYPYTDLSDPGGKTPAVYAIDGSIAMGLDRSTRRICLTFSAAPLVQIGSPSLLPLTGCHPGKVHVRPAIDQAGIGITNLGVDQSWPQSFIVYWTGFGADGRQHDYELGFRLRDQNAVTATARNTDNDISTAEQWTIEQIVPWGRVSVFQSGKGGGWRPLADYNMPFAAVAYRLIPNRRK